MIFIVKVRIITNITTITLTNMNTKPTFENTFIIDNNFQGYANKIDDIVVI